MEDDGASLHGLDKKPMSYIFDFLKKEVRWSTAWLCPIISHAR